MYLLEAWYRWPSVTSGRPSAEYLCRPEFLLTFPLRVSCDGRWWQGRSSERNVTLIITRTSTRQIAALTVVVIIFTCVAINRYIRTSVIHISQLVWIQIPNLFKLYNNILPFAQLHILYSEASLASLIHIKILWTKGRATSNSIRSHWRVTDVIKR